MTAASTQPPETEPAKRAPGAISIWLPSGRGDELQVPTTVASATRCPARAHARACCRIALESTDIEAPFWLTRRPTRQRAPHTALLEDLNILAHPLVT